MSEALAMEPGEREAFLRGRCGEDGRLLQLVRELLEPKSEFLERLDCPPLNGIWIEKDPELEAGTFGPYELLERLGEGGTSRVYLARSEGLHDGRPVALKLLKRGLETDEILRRFEREREALESLRHPGIARLLGGGTSDGGRPYLVMDYLEGERLDRYCDGRRLGIEARVILARRICDVVHHAHQRLIVHRDLKPANILVQRSGEPGLLDFGISKILDPVSRQGATRTATSLRRLTPVYASPEQFAGGPITTATDVYALGVLLFELLTGQLPYRVAGLSAAELERVVREVEPRRPSAAAAALGAKATREDLAARRGMDPARIGRQLRGDLDTILLTALAKDPGKRYGSVQALADDLGRYLEGRPILARPGTVIYRLGRLLRRRRRELGVATAVLLVFLAFTLDRRAHSREARRAKDQAAQATSFLVEMLAAADPLDTEGGGTTVRQVLGRSVEEIDRLAGQPPLQAAVLHTLGRVYTNLGSYPEARRFLERALAIRLEVRGEDHLEVAETLHQLSVLDRHDSRLAWACERAERALRIRREHLRPPAPKLASSLRNLGNALAALGLYGQAETRLQSALAMYQDLGEDPRAIANTSVDLAMVLRDREKLSDAEDLLRAAVRNLSRELGEGHLEVALGLSILATVESRQGRYEKALRTQRRSLGKVRAAVGSEHPRTLLLSIELAELLRLQEDYAASEDLLLETLETSRRALGENRKESAQALHTLGLLMASQGRAREAESYYQQALAIQQRLVGDAHFATATLLNNMATARMMLGDFERAEELLLRSLEGWRAVVGSKHPNIASISNNLGNLRYQQQDFDQAEQYFLDALSIWARQEDGSRLAATAAQQSLANLYIRRQEYPRAEELLRQALETRIDLLGESHSRVAVVLLSLGVASLDQELWPESEAHLTRALDIYRQTVSAEHQELALTLQHLAKLRRLQGRTVEAETLSREVVSIFASTFGSEHWHTLGARSQLGGILGEQGRMEEAEALLVESYEELRATLGPEDTRTRGALERLIEAYEAAGETARAAPYRPLAPQQGESIEP